MNERRKDFCSTIDPLLRSPLRSSTQALTTESFNSSTFTPDLEDAFYQLKMEQQMLGLKSAHVFTWQGQPIRSNIKRSLRSILKKANLERVTLHMFGI